MATVQPTINDQITRVQLRLLKQVCTCSGLQLQEAGHAQEAGHSCPPPPDVCPGQTFPDNCPRTNAARLADGVLNKRKRILAATLRWFTAGGAIRIVLWQLSQTWKLRHYDVIYDVIILVQDGNCKKMARVNFSIGAFYNITKNQDNPIKTVGRDSFWAPKPLKIQVFMGHPAPRGCTAPIF